MSDFWEERFREFQYGTSHPVRPADWLYPVAHPWSDFFAGTCGGAPVLVGPYDPVLLACFFRPDGVLLHVEERPQGRADPAPDPGRDALYLEIARRAAKNPLEPGRVIEALAWFNRPMRQAWDWARELGMEFGTVRVRRFALPDRRVGIEDGNRLAEEGVWEGGAYDSGEAWLRNWLASGNFVLWWSRDLWVDGDGTIFAT